MTRNKKDTGWAVCVNAVDWDRRALLAMDAAA